MRLITGLLMILIGMFSITGFGNTTTDQAQNSSDMFVPDYDVGDTMAIVVTIDISKELSSVDVNIKKSYEKGTPSGIYDLYEKQANQKFFENEIEYQEPLTEEIIENLFKPPIENRIRNDTQKL